MDSCHAEDYISCIENSLYTFHSRRRLRLRAVPWARTMTRTRPQKMLKDASSTCKKQVYTHSDPSTIHASYTHKERPQMLICCRTRLHAFLQSQLPGHAAHPHTSDCQTCRTYTSEEHSFLQGCLELFFFFYLRKLLAFICICIYMHTYMQNPPGTQTQKASRMTHTKLVH